MSTPTKWDEATDIAEDDEVLVDEVGTEIVDETGGNIIGGREVEETEPTLWSNA